VTKAKYDPAIYAAMKSQGLSNRQIATALGVNEASVRRGLKNPPAPTNVRRKVTIVIEEFDAD
jgi:DNA-binding NarL/FixJ family response regulator